MAGGDVCFVWRGMVVVSDLRINSVVLLVGIRGLDR